MHASSTTRELAAFISRPALRAMEGVARQLGARLPEETSVASTREPQEPSASTPGTLAPESTQAMPVPPGVSRPTATRSAATSFTPALPGSPAAPVPNASRAGLRGAVPSAARLEAPRIQTEAPGASTHAPVVSQPQPPPRVETRGGTPDAPAATTGTTGQAAPARAQAPAPADMPAPFRAQQSLAPADVPAPFRAQQDSATHAAFPLASEATGESSSGPTVPRIELHGPAPLAASAPAPHAPGAVSQEATRPAPPSAAPTERRTRVVRLLPAAHFQAQSSAPSGAPATFQAQQDSITHAAFPLASEATGESSSGPTVPRIEFHGPAPLAASAPAPHSPGAVSQEAARQVASSAASVERSTRVVRLLSGAHFQAQASASSGAPATFQAQQDSATHAASPLTSEAADVSSSGPTVPRIELHGPAPLAVSEATRPAPSSAAPAERSTRAVRPLSGAHPITGQAHATGNSEQVPAPVHSSTGPGSSPQPARSTPSRTRLTFLPAPEAPSPSVPMYPSPAGSGLLQQLTRAVTPVWEQAQPRTHAAPAVERASPSTHQAMPSSGAAGRDTSTTNAHPAPSAPQAELDRRSLEDALVDILRETARRHGVEV